MFDYENEIYFLSSRPPPTLANSVATQYIVKSGNTVRYYRLDPRTGRFCIVGNRPERALPLPDPLPKGNKKLMLPLPAAAF